MHQMNLNNREFQHLLNNNKSDELMNQSQNQVKENQQNSQVIKGSKQILNSIQDESKQVGILQDLREIDEYQIIIENQHILIEELQVQISELKQTVHEKEVLMLEIMCTLNVNIKEKHQKLTKEHFKEIIAQKEVIQELQKQKQKEKEIEIEESKRLVQIHHESVIQRYERQLESSLEKIYGIQQQLQAVTEELTLERLFKQELIKIGENIQEGYEDCKMNRMDSNSRNFHALGLVWLMGIAEDLIKGRNELVKSFFEDISYFMRELHQQIQNTQTLKNKLFLQRVYAKTYERLEMEVGALNKETEMAFRQMEQAANPLKKILGLYEPLKTHMHQILILLLDILSQILMQEVND